MTNRREVLQWVSTLPMFASSTLAKTEPTLPYRDANLPTDRRVADLLGRMTLEEKIAQITSIWEAKSKVLDASLSFDAKKASENFPYGIGQLTRASDRRGATLPPGTERTSTNRWRSLSDTVAFVNAAQRWATTQTRLGIPILVHEESLHGLMAPDSTSFPQAIALAGTFDRELMKEVSSVIAREARARGAHLVLSPVVDVARDPRWGRIEETFGEDPYVCGEMGVAAVTGLQGPGVNIASDKVLATLKHLTGHGQPQAGNNVGPAPLSIRELRENFFPPFRKVISSVPVGAVMPSYNEIDGVPSHKNRWLLSQVLRGEWQFGGAVVSDYDGVEQLETLHHVAADASAAAREALHAGVDCNLPDGIAFATLSSAVAKGLVSESTINRACGHMLALKFRVGLFERPFVDVQTATRITGDASARDLALRAAHKSICLLTNDGVLPLRIGAHKRIAVIGPNAAIARLGGYSSNPKKAISLLDGIRGKVGAQAQVLHAQGVFITRSEDTSSDRVELADADRNRQLIEEAVALAKTVDLIVLAIGDTEQTSREGFAANHLGDRTSLDLVGEQNLLFSSLRELGKPIVVVALNGRPPSYPQIAARANALLECWYLGQEGGTAMADVIFGDTNPGAKLPVTVARHVGQLPLFYNRKPSALRGYLFDTATPLFPFGHGLSYTRFAISEPRLSKTKIGTAESVAVEVDVRNIGDRAGDEVVQLYVHDRIASITRPLLELKGFERVSLDAGKSTTVRFRLEPDAFSMWNAELREIVEPGLFDILVGPNSVDLKKTTLEIV